MSRPIMYMFGDQSFAVADSYWMCGDNILRNGLPPRFIGRCTLVRVKIPTLALYDGVNDILKVEETSGKFNRFKRQLIDTEKIHLDNIGIPTGIPQEFRAQDEFKVGFASILP